MEGMLSIVSVVGHGQIGMQGQASCFGARPLDSKSGQEMASKSMSKDHSLHTNTPKDH